MDPSFTTKTLREIVEEIDGPERHDQSLYPVVYTFSGNRRFKDSGPNSGVYAPPS